MILYSSSLSGYSTRIRMILDYKRIPYEIKQPPGGYGSKEYMKIVPSGKIPALFYNNRSLSESMAIAEYLDEVKPLPPLYPETLYEKGLIRALCLYHDTTLEPLIRELFPEIESDHPELNIIYQNLYLFSEKLTIYGIMQKEALKPLNKDKLWMSDFAFMPTLLLAMETAFHFSFKLEIPNSVSYRTVKAQMNENISIPLRENINATKFWFEQNEQSKIVRGSTLT